MRPARRTVGSLVAGLALLLGAPAAARAYDGGIAALDLADARPGAVPRPFSIRIAQSTARPQPQEVRLAVQGLALDPGTSTGRRIGSVDFETSVGPFRGLAVATAGAGDGAPGRWTLVAPGIGPIAATVRPSTDLDGAGAPVAASGSTLVGIRVPTDLPLGATLSSVTLHLNVDDRGCATPSPGAINPAVPGTYRVRAFVGATDGTSRVSDAAAIVRQDAPVGRALAAGCPAPPPLPSAPATPTTPTRPALRLSAPTRRVAPGRRLRIRVRAANGPVDVRVTRGARTLGRLRGVRSRGTTFVFRAARADAGRLVRLTFRPQSGRARTLAVRVGRR